MNEDYFALRLITFNIFQPPWLSALYGRLFRVAGSNDRDARFIELCNNLHYYDICCLQECHNELIVDKLQTFDVRGMDPQPEGKLSRTARSYYYNGSNGGLVTAARKDLKIIWSYNYKFTYCADEDMLNRSVSFTLINMDSYWSGRYLLICNLHLYGGGTNGNTAHTDNIVREQQRSEIYGQLMQIHSKQLFPLGFTWDKCGVIICGCFNAANGGQEHRKILESFGKARDLLASSSVRTFDTDRNPYANRRKMKDTSRMDFILALDSIVCERGTTLTLPLTADNANINTDLVVSDHYSVCASIYPIYSPPEPILALPSNSKSQKQQIRHLTEHAYIPQIVARPSPSAPPMPNVWEEYPSAGFNGNVNSSLNYVVGEPQEETERKRRAQEKEKQKKSIVANRY
jgi:endonuclease/exonuclease/phosphatase family metal-dependent hydrolase